MSKAGELATEPLPMPATEQSAVTGSFNEQIFLVAMLQAAAIAFIAVVATSSEVPMTRRPWDPLLLSAVAISMAQCSLGGIWWARSSWPWHLKTLVAMVGCAAFWGMLLAVLDESRGKPDRAAGWAAALATQFFLTSIVVAAIEWVIDFRRGRRPQQFTILSLLIWTTLVACVLACGRWLSDRFGWTPGNFFSWEYFRHLQAMGVINAILAVSIFASVRLTSDWYRRCIACLSLLVSATPVVIAMMWVLFGRNLGASLPALALLSIVHASFLALTLVLLEPLPESS